MLEIRDLCFEAEGRLILDHLSFTLADGKFLVITGPNGGGKSTLSKLIMGIETPTSGQILLNGEDLSGLSITERAKRGIGYAFQQPPRFKGFTVRDLLTLAGGEEADDCVYCRYLTSVGLSARDYLDRELDASLSGGEMKRMEIATLMARKLSLAIYDEPEAGIDLWSFAMLVDSFKAISSSKNESVIVISHQERIMGLADEILVLSEGKIRQKGPKEELLPQLMKEFDGASCLRRAQEVKA